MRYLWADIVAKEVAAVCFNSLEYLVVAERELPVSVEKAVRLQVLCFPATRA